ncbi:MAG TPA: GAF and ANTAR domain-containing protein [Blastococcus sp.]|nr:GAF and ANTAR domain-containing protein [Blastococcus sp.]
MAREQRLAEVFVELADTLVEEFDVVDFLQTLTERAVELVDADSAGLMLDDQRGRLQVVAYTDEPTRLLELLELQNDEGPCLECFATGERLANIDVAASRERWPRFAPAASDAGFAVAHAVPMRLRGHVIGALNLFARSHAPLTLEHLAVVQGLADVATIGLLHERAVRDQVVLAEQLQTALHSRILVEQAKGVLSARAAVDVSAAFQLMRTYARRTGQSLTGVADAVVADTLDIDELRRVSGRP